MKKTNNNLATQYYLKLKSTEYELVKSKIRCNILESKVEKKDKQLKKLELQLEELRIMKFGKKRRNTKTTKKLPRFEKTEKKKRTKESYRRAIPKEEEITDHLRMEIDCCPDCGAELTDRKDHIHYREDLQKMEELIKAAKRVVETTVESGRCKKCNTRKQAMEIPKQKVIIGQNIRTMVTYLRIVQGQSITEIVKNMNHQYGFKVSNGEITNILEGESKLLTPYYEYLIDLLSECPAHYDETIWKTKSFGKDISEGNYCWIKTGVDTNNQIIWFGRSRGKNVAEQLRGEKTGSIGVSDDYGAYRNIFDYHQLCWAHPFRKLRDLAESDQIKGEILKVCQTAYEDFYVVYKRARKFRLKLQSGELLENQRKKEQKKIENLFEEVLEKTPYDPEKLETIRQSLKERKSRYFTFINYPDLPLDNNKAERAIRKVVLRRKKSFGSRSQKGADVLSVLYSTIFSLLETNPEENFFSLYEEAISFEG